MTNYRHFKSAGFLESVLTHSDIETDYPSIHALLKLVAVLTPGAVDCERRTSSSFMGSIESDIRDSLTIPSLANLMICVANGPDVSSLDVARHVQSWQEGKQRNVKQSTEIF
jgi:hypothetical protein